MSLSSVAQQRYCDMEVVLNSPESGGVYSAEELLQVSISIINHGPDDMLSGDTIFLRIATSTTPLPFAFPQNLSIGDTVEINGELNVHIDSTSTFFFCVGLYNDPSSQLTNSEGQPLLVSYTDSIPENNSICHSITVTKASSHITQLDNKTSLLLFPNPAIDRVSFKSGEIDYGNMKVSIFDLSGREIKNRMPFVCEGQGPDQVVHLDISDLRYGIYIIEAFDGHKSIIGKLVVEN